MIAAIIHLLTGVQTRWRGIEPMPADAPAPRRIYFANHQSNLDALVIWASLPPVLRMATRPVAGQDYWNKTPLRRFLSKKVFHSVLIEREKITRSNNPLIALEAALADSSLIIFPEGTRRMDEDADVAPFKSGLYHLARKHPELDCVPVYLENLNRILPKGELLMVPLIAVVTFGPAQRIRPEEPKEEFLARARQALIDLAGHDNSNGNAA